MTLANLGQFEMYWSPSGRRIIARSTITRRPKSLLPRDAALIGTYTRPFNVNYFLGDLDDVLTKLSIASRARGHAASA